MAPGTGPLPKEVRNDATPLHRSAFRVAGIYLAVGVAWVGITDWALSAQFPDPELYGHLQTGKGWFFVLGSSVLVYFLAHRILKASLHSAWHERKLSLILDTVPAGIAWKDRKGHYLGCNATFAGGMKLESPRNVVGLTDHDLLWASEAETLEEHDREVLSSGTELRKRTVSFTAGQVGPRRNLLVSRAPLETENGRVEGVLLCYEDITAWTAVQDRLQQESRLNEVGRLTSGVAHDLKNVLAVIQANADILARGELSGTDAREAFMDLRGAAEGASRVVRKLLGFSRRADISMEPLDLAAVLRSLAPMLSRMLTVDYPFEVNVEEDLPKVRADPDAVEQMVLNLVTNARDATPPRAGPIRLTLRTLDGALEGHGDEGSSEGPVRGFWRPPDAAPLPSGPLVVLEVRDQGEGIGGHHLGQVFEPYFTTKPADAGTGLGLPMVRGLMEQHGGGIAIRSEEGRGTTVRLYFPAVDASSPTAPPSPEQISGGEPAFSEATRASEAGEPPRVTLETESPGGRTGTILVVDDQEDLRHTVARILRRYGHRVLTAGEGREALAVVEGEEGRIDLVLSDLTMPGMGGLELYRALREGPHEIPFALTTGQADLQDVAESDEERELPVIYKPWTVETLVNSVRDLISRPASPRPS